MGADERDLVGYFEERANKREAELSAVEAEVAASARRGHSQPSLPLAAYAGTYRDDWRGDVWIREDGGTLTLKFSRTDLLEGDMEHYLYDTFVVRWKDRSLDADAFVRFRLDYDGGSEEMTLKAVSERTDISFDFHDLSFRKVETAQKE